MATHELQPPSNLSCNLSSKLFETVRPVSISLRADCWLLAGLPDINIDDLKSNTEYHKYAATSLQIVWFWRALRSFDQTDRAKFLQFVTGSSKVPLQVKLRTSELELIWGRLFRYCQAPYCFDGIFRQLIFFQSVRSVLEAL